MSSYDRILDQAIELASNIYQDLEDEQRQRKKRNHPTPTRYQQRKKQNLINEKFQHATQKDFVV